MEVIWLFNEAQCIIKGQTMDLTAIAGREEAWINVPGTYGVITRDGKVITELYAESVSDMLDLIGGLLYV